MARIRLSRRALLGAAVCAAVVAAPAAAGIDVSLDGPTLDRWFYPFNSDPGNKAAVSVFGGLLPDGFDPNFDNRDGQMLIGFDTSAPVPTGLGPENYQVLSAVVTLTVSSDQTFAYDADTDVWQTWLPSDDPLHVVDDPGRPVELFGAAFRCEGYSAVNFPENGPFCDGCNCFPPNPCVAVRCAYPVDFVGDCEPRDVSNNFFQQFDPAPFAVGVNATLVEGQLVPLDTVLTFEINVADPCVRGYLAAALDAGMLDLVVASIFPASEQQAGTFPKIYAKENFLVDLGVVSAATLDLAVATGPAGDLDGDGAVGVTDFLALLAAWGPCPDPCPPLCPADLDGDCTVGVTDFLELLANWG